MLDGDAAGLTYHEGAGTLVRDEAQDKYVWVVVESVKLLNQLADTN